MNEFPRQACAASVPHHNDRSQKQKKNYTRREEHGSQEKKIASQWIHTLTAMPVGEGPLRCAAFSDLRLFDLHELRFSSYRRLGAWGFNFIAVGGRCGARKKK
jgi:hypothetical protein